MNRFGMLLLAGIVMAECPARAADAVPAEPDQEFPTADGRPIKIVTTDAPIIKEALA